MGSKVPQDSESAREETRDREHEHLPSRLERLFRQQHTALVRMLYASYRDMDLARDAAQAAYAKMCGFGSPSTLERLQAASPTHLRAILFTTARHIAIDWHRAHQRRTSDTNLATLEFQQREVLSPEQLCIREEARVQLERAVEELPKKCKIVFTLIELDGMTVSEAAAAIGIKEHSVRVQLGRAYEYLMDTLKAFDAERRTRP